MQTVRDSLNVIITRKYFIIYTRLKKLKDLCDEVVVLQAAF